PGLQRRTHRRRRIRSAQRPQWLAPFNRRRLSQAKPPPAQSRIDDQYPCAPNSVRGPSRRRRRGRTRRPDPAHRRKARIDPLRRLGHRRECLPSGGPPAPRARLLASGMGPAAELAAEGIEVKLDRAGVGKNLQDPYQSSFAFKPRLPGTLNEAVMSRTKSAKL